MLIVFLNKVFLKAKYIYIYILLYFNKEKVHNFIFLSPKFVTIVENNVF